MKKFKNYWAKWYHFQNCKSVWNQLKEMKKEKEWLEYLECRVDFNAQGFSNIWSCAHSHDLKTIICNKKTICKPPHEKVVCMIFYEAIKLTVNAVIDVDKPGARGADTSPFIFTTPKNDPRVQWLLAPLSIGAQSTMKTPKAKKAKTAPRRRGDAIFNVAEEDVGMNVDDDESKTWLHDLIQVVTSPGRALQESAGAAGATAALSLEFSLTRALRQGLIFCFSGEIMVNGKMEKNWSTVRRGIKDDIVKDHLALLRSVLGMDVDDLPGDQLQSKILSVLNASDDGFKFEEAAGAAAEHYHPEVVALNQMIDQPLVMASVDFFEVNSFNLPPEFCGAFQVISRNLAAEMADCSLANPIAMHTLVQKIGAEVFAQVPTQMLAAGRLVAD